MNSKCTQKIFYKKHNTFYKCLKNLFKKFVLKLFTDSLNDKISNPGYNSTYFQLNLTGTDIIESTSHKLLVHS